MTTGGRIAGLIMLTVGVTLFATFSGFLGNVFLAPRTHKDAEREPELAGETALHELRALLDRQEQTSVELRAKLERLEAQTP